MSQANHEDELKQAAILLLNMGEEQASQVLKHLDPKQVEKLIGYMNKLESVKEYDVVDALNHFFIDSTKETHVGLTSGEYIRTTLTSALGTEKAKSVLDQATLVEQYKGFENLRWQTPQLIANLLQDEHPQVISIAMTYLDNEKAAQTIKLFSKELRIDILKRLTQIGPISPTALEDLSTVLQEQLSSPDHYRILTIGGLDTTANIVNFLDSELENEILSTLSESDEKLVNQIQDRMFPFEKLSELEARSLQTLLRDVSNEELALALKGATEDIREIFFKSISARAAEMLRDDLDAMGPVALTKVVDAQKKIISLAKRLAEEGKIMLGGKSSGDMVL